MAHKRDGGLRREHKDAQEDQKVGPWALTDWLQIEYALNQLAAAVADILREEAARKAEYNDEGQAA